MLYCTWKPPITSPDGRASLRRVFLCPEFAAPRVWRRNPPRVEAQFRIPERMVDLAGLTEKQRRFCDEYLIDLNATQAAIRAGYSPKTAAAIAAENLTKPKVAENIKKRMNEKEDALIAK